MRFNLRKRRRGAALGVDNFREERGSLFLMIGKNREVGKRPKTPGKAA